MRVANCRAAWLPWSQISKGPLGGYESIPRTGIASSVPVASDRLLPRCRDANLKFDEQFLASRKLRQQSVGHTDGTPVTEPARADPYRGLCCLGSGDHHGHLTVVFACWPHGYLHNGRVCGIQGTTRCYLHEYRVHCFRMKNITLSADEQLIEQARLLAKSQHKTLNAMFREWLEQFTARSGGTQEFDALMKRLKHVQAGRRFSRDEMNER